LRHNVVHTYWQRARIT